MGIREDRIRALASSGSKFERLKAARAKTCPSEVLIKLGEDKYNEVKLAAYRNPSYPLDALEQKVGSSIIPSSIYRGLLPADSLLRMYLYRCGGQDEQIRIWVVNRYFIFWLLREKNCPEMILDDALFISDSDIMVDNHHNRRDWSVRYRNVVATRKDLSDERIRRLVADPQIKVRRAIAKNKTVSKDAPFLLCFSRMTHIL